MFMSPFITELNWLRTVRDKMLGRRSREWVRKKGLKEVFFQKEALKLVLIFSS